MKNINFQILILLQFISFSLQECDQTTCEFCCLSTPPSDEQFCVDDILRCRLVNKRNFFPFYVLMMIVGFWCVFTPLCLKSCKFVLTNQFCFGYTIFGALEKMVKKVFQKKKLNRIESRQDSLSKRSLKTLKKHFQTRKFDEQEQRKKNEHKEDTQALVASFNQLSKQDYTWKKDDVYYK